MRTTVTTVDTGATRAVDTRRHRQTLRRATAVFLVGLLIVSACSSDDGDDDAAPSTQAATATTNPPVRHHELTPEEIEEYQNDLDTVGCWAGPVDGVLGPRTEAALREFQEAEGLEVTGLFGGQSQGALIAAAQAGDTVCGDDSGEAAETATPVDEAAVHELEVWQHDLNVVGCWAGPEDGTLGPQTVAAIRNFQTSAGLTVDGQLGPQTEDPLAAAAAAGTQVCHAASSPTADPPDDGDGALDGAPQEADCQVNSAGTWQTQQQALDYIARLQAAGFGGFGVAAGQGGTVVLRPDLTEAQATELIARMNAAGFSARYFCNV
jgi:peptidoglycan hydrolase-like protein with peptidoglycan-binding domain